MLKVRGHKRLNELHRKRCEALQESTLRDTGNKMIENVAGQPTVLPFDAGKNPD